MTTRGCHVNEHDWLAEQFELHRLHLETVAYRMLGSLDEADDAVQEAWLRLSRTETRSVTNLGGWLTTVVGRVCLDVLRARKSRGEDYANSRPRDPIVVIDDSPNPEQEVLIADSVGLALLVVLEKLTPTERLAFVLHDMFAVPFDEIAPIIGRSPAATRQLASRARRRVQAAAPNPDADLSQQRHVVDAFLTASRAGDFEGLIAVLDPDVVFRADVALDRQPIRGASAVARQILARGSRFAPLARHALVNGAAGVIVGPPGRPFAVVAFTVARGRVTAIDLTTDDAVLARLSADL
jgi:RNA polymerase sigma factor (sigma-70 family)